MQTIGRLHPLFVHFPFALVIVEQAVNAAKQRARGEEPSLVKVHKKDGNLEYERGRRRSEPLAE